MSYASPVPPPNSRCNYYAGNDKGYLDRGLEDFILCVESFGGWAPSELDYIRWLDFGGSSGRILRWATGYHNIQPFIADPDLEAAKFVNEHLPLIKFHWMQDPKSLILPYPEHFFDGITALSVFTHTYVQPEWLTTLLTHYLKPGGKMMLTLLSHRAVAQMKAGNYTFLKQRCGMVTPDLEKESIVKVADCIFYNMEKWLDLWRAIMGKGFHFTSGSLCERWKQDVVFIEKLSGNETLPQG